MHCSSDRLTSVRVNLPTRDSRVRRTSPGSATDIIAGDSRAWSAADERAAVWPGRDWPLGATWGEESTNFAVYAPEATAVWVCLFDDATAEPSRPGTS